MRYHVRVLSVLYGPFHELEPAFAERLKELIQAHPAGPIAVVAPSRALADRLERLLAIEEGLPLLGVEFHTFHSLAAGLVEEAGGAPGRVVTDPAFHDRLMDQLLDQEGAASAVFRGGIRPKALASAVRSSVRDLIDAGVDAGELDEYFGAELVKEPRERENLSALLRLLRAYEQRLNELGIVTGSGLTRFATETATASAKLNGFAEIIYYGFYDLTGLQLEFFEAVTGAHPSVLYFPYVKGHPAFRFADALFEQKLLGHGAKPAPARGAAPALAPALDKLFKPDEKAASLPAGRLVVTSASGARDEAWAAAKEILRLVEGGFCAYEDVGVLARGLEPYRAALSEVFAENAIPLDLGTPEPLLSRPLAKKALNLLSLRRRDFPATLVEDILASPYLADAPAPRVLRHWRLAMRRLGIAGGWLQWRKLEGCLKDGLQLSPEREAEGEKGYRIPAEDVKELWSWIAELEEELGRGSRTWSELSRRAAAVLEKSLALPANADEDETAAWEAVLETAAGLARFDLLGTPPSWDDWLDSFEAGLKSRSVESGRAARGVRAKGVMDARGDSYRVVFLLGLQEKVFPHRVREDPLLPEGARVALRHPAGYWIRPKSESHDEERLLYYLAAASAREKLYCSYQRSDEDGKAQVPSLYLRELCRAAGTRFAETDAGRRVPRDPLEKLALLEPELLSPPEAGLALRAEQVPGYLRGAGLDGRVVEAGLARLPALRAFGKAGELDGLIGVPAEFLAGLRRDGISPSALDEFATCPFRFFAQRLLDLGVDDEASEKGELDSRTRGKIYHSALERFYGGLPAAFWTQDGAPWEKPLDSALKGAFEGKGWKELGVYPVLWESIRRLAEAKLRDYLRWDIAGLRESGFRPFWREKELSGSLPGGWPRGLEGLRGRGRLDRVDRDAAGRLRVVDYKTRWKKTTKASTLAMKGKLHQLPLYAELAAQAEPGARIESLWIHSVEEPAEAAAYEGDQWAKDREAFFGELSRRLESLAEGSFPIRPDDKSKEHGHCGRCDFSTLCRKSHGPSRARAEAAPEVE